MFGGLSIQRDGAPASGAATQRRRLALLALLAAAGERGLSREKLLGYLWPDSDGERGRGALAQALYALRRDLGAEDLFIGTAELRLNPARLPSDFAQFCAAIEARRDDEAVALYGGPLLDGFYLNDAPEFERWVETERARVALQFAEALERVAVRASAAGDVRAAVSAWRRLAIHDPLNARVVAGLMRALAAAGDRGAALQQARTYEAMLREELDLAPDPGIVALAEELRVEAPPPRTTPVPATSAPAPVSPSFDPPVAVEPEGPRGLAGLRPMLESITTAEWRVHRPRKKRSWLDSTAVVAAIVVVSLLSVLVLLLLPPPEVAASTGSPVVAIGQFRAYPGPGVSDDAARPIAEMLSTNLARVPQLQVVSTARMYELLGQAGRDSATAVMAAARQAGASELVDGTVFSLGGGRLRLDLRRTDIATGKLLKVSSVEGNDLFQLVEKGTRELAADLGAQAPSGSLAATTTRSIVAYRMYEQGLRAFYKGDRGTARDLFRAALAEDSTFAMAAYYAAQAELPDRSRYAEGMERALRLAATATERERLLITAAFAFEMDDPSRLAVAETLATRYPAETEAHLMLGTALVWDGRFLAAIPHYRRAVEMDAASLGNPSAPRCIACEGLGGIVGAYVFADSAAASEREARRVVERVPGAAWAWNLLATTLVQHDRFDEAVAAMRTALPLDPQADDFGFRVQLMLRQPNFPRLDAELTATRLENAQPAQQQDGRWWMTVSLRNQGRPEAALAQARALRARLGAAAGSRSRRAAPYDALSEAQALFDAGRPAAAAALFDSISYQRNEGDTPSRVARHKTWFLTLASSALAAAGDTARLATLADSIERLGRRSAFGRDHRLHHHVRGLLLAARGQTDPAIIEFRSAIFSPVLGYTRTNYELARLLLRAGRPAEAVPLLRSALRGPPDATNYYVTRTELKALLGEALEAAGDRAGAAAEYRWVLKAWERAEPRFAARRDSIAARLPAAGR